MNEYEELPRRMGGREVSSSEHPFLHDIVGRLSRTAAIPKPRVYIIPNNEPNAFTTGMSRNDTLIAYHTGLLEHLNKDEIEAITGHEIAHIKHEDVREKTGVALGALGIQVVGALAGAAIILSDIDFTPGDGDSNDWLSTILKIGAGIALSGAAAHASMKWSMRTSRQCELRADVAGSLISRKPWALRRGLQKIVRVMKSLKPTRLAPELSQIFFFNTSPDELEYSTHPPLSERLAILAKAQSEGQGMLPEPLTSSAQHFCLYCGFKTDTDGVHCILCGSLLIFR